MKNHQPPLRVGVFRRIADADRAVSALAAAGFTKDEISVVCPTCTKDDFRGYEREEPAGSHTTKAAATGGAIGAVLGGLTAAAGLVLSGGGALLVAGPVLLGAGAGAAAGGFIGAMSTRGIEPEIADYYDQALTTGHVLVAVDARDPVRRRDADEILERTGAEPFGLQKG